MFLTQTPSHTLSLCNIPHQTKTQVTTTFHRYRRCHRPPNTIKFLVPRSVLNRSLSNHHHLPLLVMLSPRRRHPPTGCILNRFVLKYILNDEADITNSVATMMPRSGKDKFVVAHFKFVLKVDLFLC